MFLIQSIFLSTDGSFTTHQSTVTHELAEMYVQMCLNPVQLSSCQSEPHFAPKQKALRDDRWDIVSTNWMHLNQQRLNKKPKKWEIKPTQIHNKTNANRRFQIIKNPYSNNDTIAHVCGAAEKPLWSSTLFRLESRMQAHDKSFINFLPRFVFAYFF